MSTMAAKTALWELIEQFAQQNDYVEGLKLAHNVGHQHALWAGLEWAADRGDAIVTIDADLQDDVRAIIDMTEAYEGKRGGVWRKART